MLAESVTPFEVNPLVSPSMIAEPLLPRLAVSVSSALPESAVVITSGSRSVEREPATLMPDCKTS